MPLNSSSPSLPDPLSVYCNLPETTLIILSLLVVYVFTAPLFVFALVLGYQKWRKQRSTPSSHIDVFTYNILVLELLSILGTCFHFAGSVTKQADFLWVGNGLFGIYAPGEMLFHLVTCVERYLAVVHPVVYLRLRGYRGVRIRNVTIGCIWLLSLAVMVLLMEFVVPFNMISGLLLSFTSIAFGFCSLPVLCVLIRPRPGVGGGAREHDQSKQRAFNTMMVITGALSLRFLTNLIFDVVQSFLVPLSSSYCVIGWSSVWFLVPSSLVLPLLFLQREGRLPGCGPRSDESA